jgi:hypothetical protein
MSVTAEIVNEKLKEMRQYEKDHYGLPDGPDFPLVAEALAKSEEAAFTIMLHFLFVNISGKSIATEVQSITKEGLPEEDYKKRLCGVISKCESFRSYVDAVYLGYLLGQHVAETRQLEELGKK